jgi:hypothetical protein
LSKRHKIKNSNDFSIISFVQEKKVEKNYCFLVLMTDSHALLINRQKRAAAILRTLVDRHCYAFCLKNFYIFFSQKILLWVFLEKKRENKRSFWTLTKI